MISFALALYFPGKVPPRIYHAQIALVNQQTYQIYGPSPGCNVAAALLVAQGHPELGKIVTVTNDAWDWYLSTEVFGASNKKEIPSGARHTDECAFEQLKKRREHLEILS